MGDVVDLTVKCPACDVRVLPAEMVEDRVVGFVCQHCASGARLIRVLEGTERP